MNPFQNRVRRLVYPALAVAVGLSTIIGGLYNSTYLRPRGMDAGIASNSGLNNKGPAVGDTVGMLNVALTHTRIDSWVNRLSTSLRGDFTQSLGRMGKYSPMINAKLDERQMPRELIYLAMIESNFNPNARSRVGAVGMWQFMSATARQLGLTVTGKVDERKDPAEATDAALQYLSDLHTRFGSWYLAAAAYNSGEGTVSKALKKVTGKRTGTDEDFFRIMPELPRETQDYVPKLIASARVGANPAQYGIDN